MPLSGSAFWACIMPVGDRTNLITNPSFERGTTGWGTISAGTLGTSSAFQQFGAWSGSYAPTGLATAGFVSPTWTAANGSAYTISAYIRAQNGIPYRIAVADSAGLNFVSGGTLGFTGGGTWHRYSFSYTEPTGATRTLVTTKASDINTGVVYHDGWQVELGSLTTYIDGDQEGCIWLGVPHNSTSTRSGTYRGGGTVIALADLGLKPDQFQGIGMPPQEITSQSFALAPGAEYQRSRATERPFVLSFSPVQGTTLQGLHVTRRAIINALKPGIVDPQQPIRFWYTGGQGTMQIDAVYHSGLDFGDLEGPMAENGAVKFVAHDPYWYTTTQEGTALAGRAALGSTNWIAKRDQYGRWGTLGANGSTLQGVPNALAADAAAIVDMAYNDGTLFFCGSFGSFAGTSYNDIGMYFPASNLFGTLVGGTLGTNTGRPTRALLYAPWGSLYIGGDWIKAGGTFGAIAIASWNANGFGTLIGGTIDAGASGSSVRTIAMLGGTLFLGGRFTFVNGTSPVGSMCFWSNNGSFGSLVTDAAIVAGIVRQMVVGPDNAVYAAGVGRSGTTNNVEKWAGSWSTSMGTGVYGGVSAQNVAIASEPNGKIVTAGVFANTDSGSINNIAEWNGQSWIAMGTGIGDAASWLTSLVADQQTGDVYVAGRFSVAGGLRTPDGLAKWNGYAWLPMDIDVSGQGTFTSLLLTPDRTLYAAGSFQGTAQAAAVAQIINTGMAEAYPTVKIRNIGAGTVRWYQLVNTFTDDGIYMNYVLQSGEEVTLQTTPGARSLTSSAFGNIYRSIVPGSNIASFRLMPGTNFISLFCDSGSVDAKVFWRPRSDSVDGGTIY